MNFYDIVFTSSIYTAKKSYVLKDVWKFACIFYPTIAMASNVLFLCMYIEENFNEKLFPFFEISFMEYDGYNFFISIMFYLILLTIFNYYNILYKNKYKIIIKKNIRFYNKKVISIYFILSFFSPIIYLLTLVEIRI
jgi:hypothetical protein